MRAALYARYSSEVQNAGSIADQFRVCRQLAERIGAEVIAEHSDAAISGAVTANRPGLQNLLASAARGELDIIVTEALDRLTRSGGDAWDIFEDLRAVGVAIHTIAEGEVEELAVGLKGTMNALFLRELSRKVRRGMVGVALDGRAGGGRPSYGYSLRRTLDAHGEIIRGERDIDEAEARVVRRIFTDYVAGRSPRAIAEALNIEGVASPTGRQWNASTIHGNAERGNGILHNELYRGVMVWGRHEWVKDRRTGKRRARTADPSRHVRQDVPELRIVSDDLWAAARARHAALRHQVKQAGNPSAANRPRRLLAGLVRCGVCRGPMTICGDRFQCATRRERGVSACANGRTARVDDVERRVVEAIRANLLDPAVIEEVMREYHRLSAETKKAARAGRTAWETELGEVQRRAARLVDQVAEGVLAGAAVSERLRDLERRRAQLEQLLAGAAEAETVIDLHPSAPAKYRQLVDQLQTALAGEATPGRDEARAALRELVSAILMSPLEERGQYNLIIEGDLATFLGDVTEEGVMRAVGAGGRSQRSHNTRAPFRLAG